jgi:hypothetical protein
MAEHHVSQRLFAEFVGTALLVFIGAGSVPAILLLESGSKAPFSGADLGFIAMAFGLIIVALVYTIGKVSGCHINPAVTFALAVTKRFPWREVPSYWAAQVAGGVAGAFAMWGVLRNQGRRPRVRVRRRAFQRLHDDLGLGDADRGDRHRDSCCSRFSASSTPAHPRAGPGS